MKHDELEALIEERARFDVRIDELKAERKANVLQAIRNQMELYGIDISELAARPRKNTKVKVLPKYQDPETGKTWTGRGRMPRWAAGKDLTAYLIKY